MVFSPVLLDAEHFHPSAPVSAENIVNLPRLPNLIDFPVGVPVVKPADISGSWPQIPHKDATLPVELMMRSLMSSPVAVVWSPKPSKLAQKTSPCADPLTSPLPSDTPASDHPPEPEPSQFYIPPPPHKSSVASPEPHHAP